MKNILAALAVLMLFVPSAQAEMPPPSDHEERLALSHELHDIRRVRERILEDVGNISMSLPEVEREDFRKYIELSIDFDALEKKSVEYAADIYTAQELRAMISYFGSPEGRSAETKSREYGEKFGADVRKEIDKALMAAKFDKVDALPHSGPTIDMLGK